MLSCSQDTADPAIVWPDVPQGPFVLVVCAGPEWTGDMEAASREVGAPVFLIDPLRGGGAHDITRAAVEAALVVLCGRSFTDTAPCVLAAHFAPPCRSFSPLNKWRGLRTRSDPEGEAAPFGYREYIRTENAIIRVVLRLAEMLLRSGRPVTVENPPDLAEIGRPWYWPAMQDIACLWVMTRVRELRETFDLRAATAPMCAFGSEYLKYFTILASPALQDDLSWLAALRCSGVGRHAEHTPAKGRAASGVSHAARAGRYPRHLNMWLLRALVRAADGSRRCLRPAGVTAAPPRESSDREPPSSGDGESSGDEVSAFEDEPADQSRRVFLDRSRRAGFVLAGPELDGLVRSQVEDARRAPAEFASLRNRLQASGEELDKSPLPDVRVMARQLAVEACTDAASSAADASDRIQWD